MVRVRRQVPALTTHNFTYTDITVSREQNIVYTYSEGEETGTSPHIPQLHLNRYHSIKRTEYSTHMVRVRRQVPALTSHNFTYTDITVSREQNIVPIWSG